MANFYDEYNQQVDFGGGETSFVTRGKPNIDSDDYKLAAQRYKINSVLSYQLEHEAMSEQLLRDHPDGLGYAESVSQYSQGRIKDIINNAADEETKLELTHTLGQMYINGSKQAKDTETKILRNTTMYSRDEAISRNIQDSRKDPENLQMYRQQTADVIYQTGKALNYNPEDIAKDIAEADKKVVRGGILGAAALNPKEAAKKLFNGTYDNVISQSEKKVLARQMAQFDSAKETIKQLPPIDDLVNNSRTMINSKQVVSHDQLVKMYDSGKIDRSQLEVGKRLLIQEEARTKDPMYAQAKQALDKTEPEGISPAERDMRMRSLQQLFDGQQLTFQAADQINRETQQRLRGEVNNQLLSANLIRYVTPSVEKLDNDKIKEGQLNIAKDIKLGKLTLSEGRKLLRTLNNAKKVL